MTFKRQFELALTVMAKAADAIRPYVELRIEAFGPGRCIFESHFPADTRGANYHVLCNALKHMAASMDAKARGDLFCGTVARLYGMGIAEVLA